MIYNSKLDPIPTAAVLIRREKDILMVEHGPASNHRLGILGLPGGKPTTFSVGNNGRKEVVSRESSPRTVIRELYEETGLIGSPGHVYPTDFICFADMNGKSHMMRLFACTQYSGQPKSRSPWETQPLWVPYDEIHDLEKEGDLEVNIYTAIQEGMRFLDTLR